MSAADRRVRQLRVSSQDKSSIASDIHAIQDAFNIASMPGLPPNGLLMVKKLDLGVFRTGSHSISISRLIDLKMKSEILAPVCVDQIENPASNIVWFSDESAAVIALVKLSLNHQKPTAWYWRTILPSLTTTADLVEVVVAVVRDLPPSEKKSRTLVSVMQYLVSQNKNETIFELLGLPMVQTMANEVGLYPSIVVDNVAPANIQLPKIPHAWSALIEHAIQVYGKKDSRIYWLAYCALTMENPALVSSRIIWPSIRALIKHVQPRNPPLESHISSHQPQKKSVKQRAVETRKLFRQQFKSYRLRTPGSLSEIDTKTKTGSAPEKTALDEAMPSPQFVLSRSKLRKWTVRDRLNTHYEFEGLIDCEFSGLGFLISLLNYLSIDELLSKNPVLVEINFPLRIFRSIGRRFGIDDEHVLSRSLPAAIDCGEIFIEDFMAPEHWQALLRWQLPRRPTLNELEIAVQLLMSRVLFRHTRLSLRNLVMREGRIAVTRTHLDFIFDSDQVDIRIRRAGIDINPGWVNWLGMVVQFHYRQEESADD